MRATIFLCMSFVFGLSAVPAIAHHWCGGHRHDPCGYRGHDCWRGPELPSRSNNARASVAAQLLEGRIAEIIYLPEVASNGGMVEARVVSGSRSTLVRLAPAAFLKDKSLLLREGDTISLTGYMVSGMEGDLLVATEIRKGEQRVALRDSRGRLIE